jgi:hypothetical protein
VIQLPLWEAELGVSCDEQRTEELQTRIDNAKTASELGVRKAQLEFYNAFSNHDLERMERVWASGEEDCDCECIHPGMAGIHGREMILRSWAILFQSDVFSITPSDTTIQVCGSTAICRCVESVGESTKLEALNIYTREEGAWKMTLHMASPIAMMTRME